MASTIRDFLTPVFALQFWPDARPSSSRFGFETTCPVPCLPKPQPDGQDFLVGKSMQLMPKLNAMQCS